MNTLQLQQIDNYCARITYAAHTGDIDTLKDVTELLAAFTEGLEEDYD